MGETTAIEWCHHTFNPWWGCRRVSEGCRNCYAATLSQRFDGDALWSGAHRRTKPATWNEPRRWNKAAIAANERRRVFCASMADVFESSSELDPWRADLWPLIEATPGLDWLLLTKRPQNIRSMVPAKWLDPGGWPNHVWVGTSVEDQDAANARIPRLLGVPARVRFLSMEPLLGPVDLTFVRGDGVVIDALRGLGGAFWPHAPVAPDDYRSGAIQWVIVGGESGPHARPMHPQWVRSVRDQCVAAGVPFFFKQWGEWAPTGTAAGSAVTGGWSVTAGELRRGGRVFADRVGKKAAGRLLDGRTWDEVPR